MRSIRRILLASAAVLLAIPARADTITLRTGATYEGRLVEQSRSLVVFDALIHGIQQRLEFRPYEVRTIVRGPVPAGLDEPSEAAESPGPADDPAPGPDQLQDGGPHGGDDEADEQTEYLRIPARGPVGETLTAAGVRDALDYAERRDIRHIVFQIDSPGGLVYEAVALAALLEERRDDFTFHAVVEKEALSAATVLVASSRHVYVTDQARVGAAVSFGRDVSSGSAEVDQKLNSAWSAQLQTLASTNDHEPLLFRAMVVPEAMVYAETLPDGATVFHPDDPRRDGTGSATLVDGPSTILTLTADEMIRYGIARAAPDDLDALGSLAGIPGWADAGNFGARAMTRVAEQRARIEREYARLSRELNASIDRAKKADPRTQVDLVYYPETGVLTPETRSRWQKACRAAHGAWSTVRINLDKLDRLDQQAVRSGALHLRTNQSDWIEDARKTCREHMDWIRANTNARTIDEIS